MKRAGSFIAGSVLLCTALLLAGCAPLFSPRAAAVPLTGKAAPQTAGMVPVPPRPLEFPVGRYKSLGAPGPLVISIHNDGRFLVFRELVLIDSGTITSDGEHLLIEMESCGGEGIKPALYDWLDGEGVLSFSPVGGDECSARRDLLSESFEPQVLLVDNLLQAGLYT